MYDSINGKETQKREKLDCCRPDEIMSIISSGRQQGASTNPRSSISVVELPRDQQIFAQDEEDENQAFADFAAG